jgi:putative spermidine/putrescine transport system substrate-binding protein
MKKSGITALSVAAFALFAAACGDDGGSGGGAALKEIGTGEGQLDIVVWAGYAEDGSTDPTQDWVTPFETETGCQVNVKVGNSSDDMVQLMKSGSYDGVSASGDASLRLIVAGDVAPVNVALLTNYPDSAPFLKDTAYNSYKGKAYGQPHGWGANLLQFNTAEVSPAPDSWGAVFDKNSPYKGKVTAYDSPIYIADAALYLMDSQPDLKITNPYALDQGQFDAAVALLKVQRKLIGEYWKDYAKQQAAFEAGSLVIGTTWQVIANYINAGDKAKVDAVLPKEGSTAWSDTWMISSKAKHPNCTYLWMNHISSPEVQAQVAQWYGQAPANVKACNLDDTMKAHCAGYHATDEVFHTQLHYWTTPTKACLDGRGDKCVGYDEWSKAWTEIKG